MKPMILDSSMTTMGGVFYPTGHVFALFADEDSARKAEGALKQAGHRGETAYASPDTMLEHIAHTLGETDTPLPSVGAEGDIVRRVADLASKGHHGVLIAMADHDDAETVASALTPLGAVAAFYYRRLIIEDLITQHTDDDSQSVVVGTHAAPR